jgi:leucyl-tRNA synthetase
MLLLISLKDKAECLPSKYFDKDIERSFWSKDGFKLVDSDFLNGLGYKEGTYKSDFELEKLNQGFGKINYRLRDAVFASALLGRAFPSVLCKWLATND